MNQINTMPDFAVNLQTNKNITAKDSIKDGQDGFGQVMKQTIKDSQEPAEKEPVTEPADTVPKRDDKKAEQEQLQVQVIPGQLVPLLPTELPGVESSLPQVQLMTVSQASPQDVQGVGDQELLQTAVVTESVPVTGQTSTQVQAQTQSDGQIPTEEKTEMPLENKAEKAPVTKSTMEEQPVIKEVPKEAQEKPQVSSQPTVLQVTPGNEESKNPMQVTVQTVQPEEEKPVEQAAESEVRPAELAATMPKQTETVRIKVAEPHRQVDQQVMTQLANQISEKAAAGTQELHIQLDPENLGKISIKIALLETGVKVVLSCDNQKTMNLLADRAAGISRIVEDNMQHPVVVEVKEDGYWNQQKNATDQHNNQQQQQQQQQKKETTDDFIQQLRLGLFGEKAIVG